MLGKYLLVLFTVILFSEGILASESRKEMMSQTNFKNGLVCIVGERDAYTGTIVSNSKVGGLKATMRYKDGLLDGEKIIYYNNSLIKSRETYVAGKKEGFTYIYYENGQLMMKTNYSNDKKDGEKVYYHKSGELGKITTYKSGKKVSSNQL